MITITRTEAGKADKLYRDMLKTERHHKHEIIIEAGTMCWKKNPDVEMFLKNISLNDLCPLLQVLGYDKNSEVYRNLYRSMGYSLFGYWEVFYWEANNPDANLYSPPVK